MYILLIYIYTKKLIYKKIDKKTFKDIVNYRKLTSKNGY